MAMNIKVITTGILSVNTLIVPLTKSQVFVVDPAGCTLSNDEHKVTDYLLKNKLECVAIILTHSHFDHITGIKEAKNAFPNAVIAIHENEFEELQSPPGPMGNSVLSFFGLNALTSTIKEQPSAEFSLKTDSTLKSLGEEFLKKSNKTDSELLISLDKWKILLTPGHTPGSICLYNESDNLLISGDTVFDYGGYGRTDMYGGDESQILESLDFLRKTVAKGTKFYPGHDSFGFEFV